MSTGNAGGYFEFFPEELIPVGMQLALDGWGQLTPADKSGIEDHITGKLAAAMKRDKKARRLAFSIHFQAIPLAPNGPVAARIDFKFLAGFNEDAYFAFEAKRLRIPGKKRLNLNTSAYVEGEGMERFIIGKYAPGQPHGAMLAYVMDGNVAAAIASVRESVRSSSARLNLVTGGAWETSRFLPTAANIFQTRHTQNLAKQTSYELTLQHVFFAAEV